VDDHLRAIAPNGEPAADVFVIGDSAAVKRHDGRWQPALSQTAIAMGAYVGDELIRRASGRPSRAFAFRDAGYIISLGKHSSVLELFGFPLSGKLAWLMWAGAYLIKMVGFRKQIEVGFDQVTHLFFEHDISQIMNRRNVLSDDEMNLSLSAGRERDARPVP
jgi:NADH dehydrogenase